MNKQVEMKPASDWSTDPEISFNIPNPPLHAFDKSRPKLAPKPKISSISAPVIIHTLWFNLSPVALIVVE